MYSFTRHVPIRGGVSAGHDFPVFSRALSCLSTVQSCYWIWLLVPRPCKAPFKSIKLFGRATLLEPTKRLPCKSFLNYIYHERHSLRNINPPSPSLTKICTYKVRGIGNTWGHAVQFGGYCSGLSYVNAPSHRWTIRAAGGADGTISTLLSG